MYCVFCDVLCIVCVYMCTELLPPGGYPIAVKYINFPIKVVVRFLALTEPDKNVASLIHHYVSTLYISVETCYL